LAKDVSQLVFTDLARSAGGLKKNSILSAWLYEVTRRTAIDFIRKESRRQAREQIYTEMNAMNVGTEDGRDVLRYLDEAMAELNGSDRAIVLLRFFENKSLREVGAELGVSDDAARKRVSRAVERLRDFLAKRGVAVGVGGLIALVSANAVQAAPAGLGASISVAALAGASVPAGTAVGSIAKLLLQKPLAWTIGTVGVLTGIVIVTAHFSAQQKNANTMMVSEPTSAEVPAPTVARQDVPAVEALPDPVKLLQGIIQARQQIHSGSAEFQYSVDRFSNGRTETRQLRFLASFDDSKLRFESFGTEYSYTYDEDEDKQKDISTRADSMDKESAVRAGLLKPFPSHHTMISDGTAFYDFWQTGDSSPYVSIRAVTNGTANYIFDPRCIGIAMRLGLGTSVESLLYTKGAELVGEDNLDGNPAYHVRVKLPWGGTMEYWIDKDHPERLLQLTDGHDILKSKYDESNLADPIPVEVDATNFRNGVLSDTSRLLCSNKSYNTPVGAESFTLAGLGLPVGTPVNDDRIYRRIGYWTGSGLSEDFPSKKNAVAEAAPKLEELLAVLENDPASTNGLNAALRIILNTPDGAAVQKAAEVIEREHVTNTNLVHLCQELDRVRPSSAKELLEALLHKNPSVEVKGYACFTLATLWKDEAKYGQNKKATDEAVTHYEQVINEFSAVKQRGFSLAELAKPELMELQRLIIGKPAPETEGVDMNGQPLKLSAYRGQVVVLVFWSGQFTEALSFRKLNEDMAGKPFALIGVNCDNASGGDKASHEKVNWPSFKDGRGGPIATLWNVHSWTDTWILDRQGIIRYRDLRGSEIRDAVNKLLEE
jgi:RNA polymerase sigma factor (sigma-70 family)